MNKSSYFVVNTPEVVSEVIDGELVAIHLGSGCYYHANKSGSYIWDLLTSGLSQKDAVMKYAEQYHIESDEAKKTVAVFCTKLLDELLVREEPKAMPSNLHPVKKPVYIAIYEEPTLKKHEDMKELLLLDPIHDVGDQSWPLTTV
jgi:hypothetical protein